MGWIDIVNLSEVLLYLVSCRLWRMAGKPEKGKAKRKSNPEAAPDAATVASQDVQPLKSATGQPELGLKSNQSLLQNLQLNNQ